MAAEQTVEAVRADVSIKELVEGIEDKVMALYGPLRRLEKGVEGAAADEADGSEPAPGIRASLNRTQAALNELCIGYAQAANGVVGEGE